MKIVQTLFVGKEKSLLSNAMGWYAPIYNIMGWALSSLSLAKYNSNIELYTDEPGFDVLIKTLHLPYSVVHSSFEGWALPHPKAWALSKIKTYSEQKYPFLHVDGDVFVDQDLSQRFYNSQLVAQNTEHFTPYYIEAANSVIKNFTYIPPTVAADFSCNLSSLFAVNAGILGGNDLSFIAEYSSQAFEYIINNIHRLHLIDVDKFNVLCEQHLFYSLAHYYKKDIDYLLDEEYDYDNDMRYADFCSIHKYKYIHMLGNYKKNEFLCYQLAKVLKERHPEVFKSVINLFSQQGKNTYCRFIDNSQSKSQSLVYLDYSLEPIQLSYSHLILNSLNLSQKTDFLEYIDHINEAIKDIVYSKQKNSNIIESFDYYFSLECQFVKSKTFKMIESTYNWTRLYRRKLENGHPYYEYFEMSDLVEGHFDTIILAGIDDRDIKIIDIDGLDYAIIKLLETPLTINDVNQYISDLLVAEIESFNQNEWNEFFMRIIKRLYSYGIIIPQI